MENIIYEKNNIRSEYLDYDAFEKEWYYSFDIPNTEEYGIAINFSEIDDSICSSSDIETEYCDNYPYDNKGDVLVPCDINKHGRKKIKVRLFKVEDDTYFDHEEHYEELGISETEFNTIKEKILENAIKRYIEWLEQEWCRYPESY